MKCHAIVAVSGGVPRSRRWDGNQMIVSSYIEWFQPGKIFIDQWLGNLKFQSYLHKNTKLIMSI